MTQPVDFVPMPPSPDRFGRANGLVAVATALVVVAVGVLGASGVFVLNHVVAPPRFGLPSQFNETTAAEIDADYAACPTPTLVRTQSRVGGLSGSPWRLWVVFEAESEAAVQQIVTTCLQLLPPYDEALWDPFGGVGANSWGTGSYFQSEGPLQYTDDVLDDRVEFLEVDDVTRRRHPNGDVRYEGRAVAISRNVETHKPNSVNVLLIEMSG